MHNTDPKNVTPSPTPHPAAFGWGSGKTHPHFAQLMDMLSGADTSRNV